MRVIGVNFLRRGVIGRQLFVVCLVVISIIVWACHAVSGQVQDFVVIQSGQPGSSEEAQPVMDSLADYIQKKIGHGVKVKGRYFNDLDKALGFVRDDPPDWGIVRVGFYAQFVRGLPMTVMASTRPGGFSKDMWHLVVKKNAPEGWRTIRGTVFGNMLFETDAGACLLFRAPNADLPFKLKGTFHPLRSLRAVVRGKTSGVVLDRMQHEAIKALPLADKIKVMHSSGRLPTSPVVWFGPPNERMKRVMTILLGMGEDPDAGSLLKLLQTDGFGPADADLPKFRLNAENKGCPW